MITILTTIDHKISIEKMIATVDRLDELVTVSTGGLQVKASEKLITVENNTIQCNIDWHDTEVPILFQDHALNEGNLLAIVHYKLGNQQRAFEFIQNDNPLHNELLAGTYLQYEYAFSQPLNEAIQKTSLHNAAVVYHYGAQETPSDLETAQAKYERALKDNVSDEVKAFTSKHYVNFLLDAGDFKSAETVAEAYLTEGLSNEAKNALLIQKANAMIGQLLVPYNTEKLDAILNILQDGIEFYEEKQLNINAALLAVDASEMANYKSDFITAKELINKAILHFRNAEIPEFLGEATLKKAILLYTWSKNGSPQYYKAAINAFQDSLKVFKRDTHPRKFADIHHNLALIYSEIPVSPEEKPIWTAFCASSFKEVLAFYNKKEYPYEFAMASHNYATALIDFPEAKLHDNLAKANRLFKDALSVRTAESFPFERALTRLNQLELAWRSHNENSAQEQVKISEMEQMAKEIKTLVTDRQLLTQANEHLTRIEQLKTLI
ncbi:hypothetical protein ABN763_15205 [Spongiivirga sp. MCCC 1A20706]|uniref:hypothetical protein n=1 Tax=Spongiivirga sp. MCCC 1A20706 TaxID=3160963 RepID=UPI00397740A5